MRAKKDVIDTAFARPLGCPEGNGEKDEAQDSTPLPPAEQLSAAGQNIGCVLSVEMERECILAAFLGTGREYLSKQLKRQRIYSGWWFKGDICAS